MRSKISLAAALALTATVGFSATGGVNLGDATWKLVGIPSVYSGGATVQAASIPAVSSYYNVVGELGNTVSDDASGRADLADVNISVYVMPDINSTLNSYSLLTYGTDANLTLALPENNFVTAAKADDVTAVDQPLDIYAKDGAGKIATVYYRINEYGGETFYLSIDANQTFYTLKFPTDPTQDSINLVTTTSTSTTEKTIFTKVMDANSKTLDANVTGLDYNLTTYTYDKNGAWKAYVNSTSFGETYTMDGDGNFTRMTKGKAYWYKLDHDHSNPSEYSIFLGNDALTISTDVAPLMNTNGWNLVALPTGTVFNGMTGVYVEGNITDIYDAYGNSITGGSGVFDAIEFTLSPADPEDLEGNVTKFNTALATAIRSASSTLQITAYPTQGNGALLLSNSPFTVDVGSAGVVANSAIYSLSGEQLYSGATAGSGTSFTNEQAVVLHINQSTLENIDTAGFLSIQIPELNTTALDINLSGINTMDALVDRIYTKMKSGFYGISSATDINVSAIDVSKSATDGNYSDIVITLADIKNIPQLGVSSDKFLRFGVSESTIVKVYEVKDINTTRSVIDTLTISNGNSATSLSLADVNISIIGDVNFSTTTPSDFDINITGNGTDNNASFLYLFTNKDKVLVDIFEANNTSDDLQDIQFKLSSTGSYTAADGNKTDTNISTGFVSKAYTLEKLLSSSPTANTDDLKAGNYIWSSTYVSDDTGILYQLKQAGFNPQSIYSYDNGTWRGVDLSQDPKYWTKAFDLFKTDLGNGYWVKTTSTAVTSPVSTKGTVTLADVVSHFDNKNNKVYNYLIANDNIVPNGDTGDSLDLVVSVNGENIGGKATVLGGVVSSYQLSISPYSYTTSDVNGSKFTSTKTATVRNAYAKTSLTAVSFDSATYEPTAPAMSIIGNAVTINTPTDGKAEVHKFAVDESNVSSNLYKSLASGTTSFTIGYDDINFTYDTNVTLKAINYKLNGTSKYVPASTLASIDYVPIFAVDWNTSDGNTSGTDNPLLDKNGAAVTSTAGYTVYNYLNVIKSTGTATSKSAQKYAIGVNSSGVVQFMEKIATTSTNTSYSSVDTNISNGVQLTNVNCGTAEIAYKPENYYGITPVMKYNVNLYKEYNASKTVAENSTNLLAQVGFADIYATDLDSGSNNNQFFLRCANTNTIYRGNFDDLNTTQVLTPVSVSGGQTFSY